MIQISEYTRENWRKYKEMIKVKFTIYDSLELYYNSDTIGLLLLFLISKKKYWLAKLFAGGYVVIEDYVIIKSKGRE